MSIIDLDSYLKAISPDKVCGDNLQYTSEFIELEKVVQGKPEQQMGATIIEAEPPNWREVKKYCEALLSKTIDLRILIFYLRALIALEGFSGLQEALLLISTLVENRWADIHPQLDPEDDNDPTERINVLMSLCDHQTVLWPLQQLPLLESKLVGRFNLRQVNIASGKVTANPNEKEINQNTIDGAVQDTEQIYLQQLLNTVERSIQHVEQLESLITDYVGNTQAPSFNALRNLLREIKLFLTTALTQKGSSPEVDITQNSDQSVSFNTQVIPLSQSISGTICNEQDVIKVLNLVCDFYKKNQPSSPIPLFIERAMRLIGKNFMDVLEDIAPGGVSEARLILGKQNEE